MDDGDSVLCSFVTDDSAHDVSPLALFVAGFALYSRGTGCHDERFIMFKSRIL